MNVDLNYLIKRELGEDMYRVLECECNISRIYDKHRIFPNINAARSLIQEGRVDDAKDRFRIAVNLIDREGSTGLEAYIQHLAAATVHLISNGSFTGMSMLPLNSRYERQASEAITHLKEARRLNPNNYLVLAFLGAYTALSNPEEARSYCDKAIELNPHSRRILFELGQIDVIDGKHYGEGVDGLRKRVG